MILIDRVCFGYDAQAVIDQADAALFAGQVTALVGPNAAGKSTLLRLMLGLLKPWSGRIDVEGRALDTYSVGMRARRLSYVPQQPGVRFAFTVRQVVAMGAFSVGGSAADAEIDRVLHESGLSGLENRSMMTLSGGQQQRVMLARAELQSAFGGRAMLLDEPGSHMDLHHRHGMMHRLRELASGGLAVLVVLHDLDLAVRYADQAWLMQGGRVIAEGPWDRVLTPERLSPVYGLPLEQIDRDGCRPILAVGSALGDTMLRTGSTTPRSID